MRCGGSKRNIWPGFKIVSRVASNRLNSLSLQEVTMGNRLQNYHPR